METGEASGRGGAGNAASAGAGDEWLPWREAAERALYWTGPAAAGPTDAGAGAGAEGFFLREAPAAHFRTSVHASPLFALAVARLLLHVDEALGRPDRLALIDVGAGRGELLTGVLGALPAETAGRVRPYAVERAARPAELDERIVWTDRLDRLPGPDAADSGEVPLCGLLFANEWLDDVPVDIAETDADGVPRKVLVRTSDGAERLGDPVSGADAEWLERWWPLAASGGRAPGGLALGRAPGASGAPAPEQGLRAEIGRTRDAAWAAAVRTLARGLAVAVDYAHFRADRPPFGTLTGYREGREVAPVPDGSCDLTAHVALDACAAAGARRTAGTDRTDGAQREERRTPPSVLSQRAALHSLGIDGARPPLALASSDPAAYVRQLVSAGEAAELTDPGGLGAFGWLVQPLGGVPSPFGPPRPPGRAPRDRVRD